MKLNVFIFPLLLLSFFQTSSFAQGDRDVERVRKVLREKADEYKLSENDLEDLIITDNYVSKKSQVQHIYLRQAFQGIEIYGADAGIHLLSNGELLTFSIKFIPELQKKIQATQPSLSAIQAIEAIASEMKYSLRVPLQILKNKKGANQKTRISSGSISRVEIPARLVYQVTPNGKLHLAWDISIYEIDEENWWDFRVDANSGKILNKNNWITTCDWEGLDTAHGHDDNECEEKNKSEKFTANLADAAYNVFAVPVESPNHGSRSIVADPANFIASPFAWHDTNGASGAEFTITRGNNVHARRGDYSPDGTALLNFDFPFDPSLGPLANEDAAITNLFYWNNIIHDILYQYGFDEVSGNFQQNNYGNGGIGNDYVRANAQAPGNCNATFGTPPDGSGGTMNMFTCDNTSPVRDGDYDNGVITHEYGHGVSNRLTGGPSNSGALNSAEQMGEGWSDWYGLMLTMEPGDLGLDSRTTGTYLFGQSADGSGIRTHPYSTDMSINPDTYDAIKTSNAAVHRVGSIWAEMLWEMTWGLIDKYGYDPDLYNGIGGNNIALALVTEGMKLQPTGPGFVDGRDAILAADLALYNGANQCVIWQAFAKRGLGFSADQGNANSVTDGTEAFDLPDDIPGTCDDTPDFVLSMSPISQLVCPGESSTYEVSIIGVYGFEGSVLLSATNLPGNSTASFDINPVPAGSTAVMTIDVDGSLEIGVNVFSVEGTAENLNNIFTGVLEIPDTPSLPELLSPPTGTSQLSSTLSANWEISTFATSYETQIATDIDFTDVIIQETTASNNFTSEPLPSNIDLYWRVRALNICGTSEFSGSNQFIIEVCGALFTDSGGVDGPISNNEDITYVICPDTPGEFVNVEFTAFDVEPSPSGCYDYMAVYNGDDTSAPLIGEYCGVGLEFAPGGGTVSGDNSSGCLTFVFVSDFSVTFAGWEATVNCGTCAAPTISNVVTNIVDCLGDVTVTSLSEDDLNYMLTPNNGSPVITNSTGVFTGLEEGIYTVQLQKQNDPECISSEQEVTVVIPGVPPVPNVLLPLDDLTTINSRITFEWEAESTENFFRLEVATDDQFENLIYHSIINTTVRSTSQVFQNNQGTVLYWRIQAYNGCSTSAYSPVRSFVIQSCGNLFTDSGGPNGAPGNNENLTYVICPDASGEKVEVDFTAFDVEPSPSGCYDELRVYNGTVTSAPVIGIYCGVGLENAPGEGGVIADNASGCLTFAYYSDNSVTNPGWIANINCLECNLPEISSIDVNYDNCLGRISVSNTFAANINYILTPNNGDDPIISTNGVFENINNGDYTIRIELQNNQECYSESQELNVATPVIANAPILVSPENNFVGINSRVNFVWEEIEESNSYAFQVATDPLFESLVYEHHVLNYEGQTSFPAFPNNVDLYWRVRGVSACGAGPYSEVRVFRVEACGETYTNPDVNENVVTIICPDNPGDVVQVDFSSFDLESGSEEFCFNFLRVFNGDSFYYDFIGDFCGSGIENAPGGGTIQGLNETGCLFFSYASIEDITPQWNAIITCIPDPTCEPVSLECPTTAVEVVACFDDVPLPALDEITFEEQGGLISDYPNRCGGITISSEDILDPPFEVCNGQTLTRNYVISDAVSTNSCTQVWQIEPVLPLLMTCPEDITVDCNESISPEEETIYTSTTVGSYVDIPLQDSLPQVSIALLFDIPQNATILDIRISDFQASHTWVGDLVMHLESPSGEFITLMNRPGGTGEDFGSPAHLQESYPIGFNDQAFVTAENMGAGLNSGDVICKDDLICTFQPNEGTPNDFAGLISTMLQNDSDPNGVWKLHVSDLFPALDFGYIETWTLEIDWLGPAAIPGVPSIENDNCGTAVLEYDDVSNPNDFGCQTIQRTWTVSNNCEFTTSCIQTITVEDESIPTITNIATDLIIECDGAETMDVIHSWLGNHGNATAEDNCLAPLLWMHDYNGLTAACGSTGTADVTFRVTDECGNFDETTATILINDSTNPILNIPATITVVCVENADPSTTGMATATDNCTQNMDVTYVDQVDQTDCSNGTITRTWTAVDDCGNSTSEQQVIQIENPADPYFECPSQEVITCVENLNITVDDVPLITACGIEGTVTLSEPAILGQLGCEGTIYNYIYNGIDGCGRTANCVRTIVVTDLDAPEVLVEQTEVTYACNTNNIQQIFENWLSSNAGAVITGGCSGEQIVWTTNVEAEVLDCDSGSQSIEVEFTATDACGNDASFIGVFNTVENSGTVDVTGVIQREDNEPVENVLVSAYLESGELLQDISSNSGEFNFPSLEFGAEIEVAPEKNDDTPNGLTTFDLVLLQQHIINLAPLNSPYKRIAADINRSGNITSLDLILLRQVVLMFDSEFSNNTSWRFVDADFVFPNPQNPFESEFPEIFNTTGLTDEAIDFIAVKIGDLNLSGTTNQFIGETEDRTNLEELIFEIKDEWIKADEEYSIDIQARNFNQINGYQFTLEVDERIEVLGMEEAELIDFDEKNYNLDHLERGAIVFSWNASLGKDLSSEDVVFRINVKAKEELKSSEAISISSRLLQAEAYQQHKLINIRLVYTSQKENAQPESFKLFQNKPNPFSDNTSLEFYLPLASNVILNVYDISGRLLHSETRAFVEGYNQFDLDASILPPGILYYQVSTATDSASKKMIKLE